MGIVVCGVGSKPGQAVTADNGNGSAVYMIQLNAFKVEKNALMFLDRIRGQGYPAVLDHQEGERWYKVKVGPFQDWDNAKSVSRQLRNAEKLSPLILISLDGGLSGNASIPVVEPNAVSGPNLTPSVDIESEKEKEPAGKPEAAPALSGSDYLDRVIARFLAWKDAWQKRDLVSYLEFYSESFDASPRTREAWERARKRALTRNGEIRVQVGEMEVAPVGEQIEMRFIQKFQSTTFQDVGLKTLVWTYENGQWKIMSERWLPI